jgi:hypothetical protein
MADDNPYARRGLASSVVEVIESENTTTNLSADTPVDVTSVTLPAGVWMITGSLLAETTGLVPSLQFFKGKITTVSLDVTVSAYLVTTDFAGQNNCGFPLAHKVVTLATETTFYLVAATQLAITGTVYGALSCVRLK